MSTPIRLSAGLLALGVVMSCGGGEAKAPHPAAVLFDLAETRLLDGPFAHARDLDRDYLLAHDVDRFLVPFRVEAGIETTAEKYPNWESSGLDGHTAGHYLTALAQMAVTTGDAECRRRLDAMVAGLAECQAANGNGYVGAIPGSRELWAEVAAGKIRANNFAINDRWVPWYNMHKLYAGLRDAWLIAGNEQAREVLIGLADWCDTLVAGLGDEQMQDMLRAEQGGMNEALADVCAITGDEKYLALAKRFSHRATLDPLLREEDDLTGKHANTQIPKVIGFARIAALDGDRAWIHAAAFFWKTVVARRSVSIGGNSVREHFNAPDDFSSMIASREGPETCNTYNMLRLTEALFSDEPAARYADYYERALFNHILSTQHPEHGGFVYFTPMRPRHYRVYSQPGACFWCCVGSGMENHGKYERFIYARGDDALFVNLFMASELSWKEKKLVMRQDTRFPDEPRARLSFTAEAPVSFALMVRHPEWASEGGFSIRVNGEPWKVSSSPSSYARIERAWKTGDTVDIELPMRTSIEPLPDGSDYVSILRGPIVLAAKTGGENLDGLIADDSRMGHAAPGPYLPMDAAPMLVGDRRTLAEHIRPIPGQPMRFTASELIRPAAAKDIELVPFYRVHDARYMIYWRAVAPDQYTEVVARLEREERARIALEERTLDTVAPGEQQPEVEHALEAGGDSNTGAHLGRHWRDAAQRFGYTLRFEPGVPLELQLTFFGAERGRAFDVLANGVPIAQVELTGGDPDRFVDRVYPIPGDIGAGAADGRLKVEFVAREGSRAGPVYEVRLLRREP